MSLRIHRWLAIVACGAVLAAAGSAVPGGAQAPRPANDLFPGATVTTGQEILVDNTGATISEGEPIWANATSTVWYSFVATRERVGVAIVEADFPASLALYEGDTLGSLRLIASGNVASTGIFALVAAVEPGHTYRLQAGSESVPVREGRAILRLEAGDPPPNDDFPGAAVAALPFQDSVQTTWATVTEPATFGATVWYAYTASRPARLLADTFGSTFPARVAVYDAATLDLPGGRQPALRDPCDQADSLLIDVAAGETLWFQVGGSGFPGATGTVFFTLQEVAADASRNPRCALPGVMEMRLSVEESPSAAGDQRFERATVTWQYDPAFAGAFEVQRQYLPRGGDIPPAMVVATIPADGSGAYRFEDAEAVRGVRTCYEVTPVEGARRGAPSRLCTSGVIPPRPPDVGSGLADGGQGRGGGFAIGTASLSRMFN